jgi:hypothetical protein
MDHRLMMGMFLGGMVMMAPPVLLGIGIGIYVLRQQRTAAATAGAQPESADRREGGSS